MGAFDELLIIQICRRVPTTPFDRFTQNLRGTKQISQGGSASLMQSNVVKDSPISAQKIEHHAFILQLV